MSITTVNYSTLAAMKAGDKVTPTIWSGIWTNLQSKLNEIIGKVNEQSSGSSAVTDDFYVNGVKKTPADGKIQLAAFGGEGYPTGGYKLSGTLTVPVVIGTADDSPTDDTCIDLSGVTISTASTDNAAIMYMPASQTLIITLTPNSQNVLVCSNAATMADSQKGCIWSENNLVIQGNGYLACKNLGGHGIKASKMKFFGNPHVYVDAIHDGIHGNLSILLYGGIYYINKANDAFGTRAASGTSGSADYKSPGIIKAYKAKIYAYNINQNVFDSKATGGFMYVSNVSITTTVTSANILSGITLISNPTIFFGGAVWDATTKAYTTEATGYVKCYTNADCTTGETEISPVDGIYTLTTKYAKISGYINGKIVAPIKTTDIHAYGNTYVNGNIEYSNIEKKLGIYAESGGSFLVVAGSVTSASNLAIECKADSYFDILGNVDSGDITLTDSKGCFNVRGNVLAKIIYVGTAETANADKKLWGAITIDGDINVILNSKNAKGNIVALNSGIVGVFYAKRVSVASVSDLSYSHVFFNSNNGGMIIGSVTNEDKEYITC